MVISKETIEKIRKLRAEGYTEKYIAFRLKCGRNTIWKYTRDMEPMKRSWTPDEVCMLLKLKSEGNSNYRIAKMMNRSYSSVATKIKWIRNASKTL